MSVNEMLMAAAGTGGGDVNYVDDVFSTYLYTGTGATQTITNGIDLAGKGGLVWSKDRTQVKNHNWYDTVRGVSNWINSDGTNEQLNFAGFGVTAFSSSGFTVADSGGSYGINQSTKPYVSWTFREQAKFFDVVTYTGNGGTTQSISHSLSSIPRFIIVKSTSNAANWKVLAWDGTNYQILYLNLTNAGSSAGTLASYVSSTAIDFGGISTNIESGFNTSGQTYVAYLFAHDAGGFGAADTDNVISCGSFTTNTSGFSEVNLGYEPQYILFKKTNGTQKWYVWDVMRGMSLTSSASLSPNLSDAELNFGASSYVFPTARGFAGNGDFFGNGSNVIYMAIRRPMKPPTSGTQVYNAVAYSGTSASRELNTTFPIDTAWIKQRTGSPSYSGAFVERLVGNFALYTALTNAQDGVGISFTSYQNGFNPGTSGEFNGTGSDYVIENFKRASGFHDIVCYTGTGSARTVAHNLGVTPELMIVKKRNSATSSDWIVWNSALDIGDVVYLQANSAKETAGALPFNNTLPTTSVFSLGTWSQVNASSSTYVAYLFASVAGVSKVGSYTGNGSSQTINCGFTAGARFVMIKRTDSTGDWVVLDTARGIVSGNDPFLQLNSTAAEVTGEDIVDPANSGFIVNSTTENINASGGSYIYLAIS